eukprot:1566610-Pyramimonas_sp.AAC.1
MAQLRGRVGVGEGVSTSAPPLRSGSNCEPTRAQDVLYSGRRRPQDTFPLPYPFAEGPLNKAAAAEFARGARQRIGRRRGVCNDVLQCASALTWLSDPSLTCGRDLSCAGPSLAQN